MQFGAARSAIRGKKTDDLPGRASSTSGAMRHLGVVNEQLELDARRLQYEKMRNPVRDKGG
jgi:hypothetical protein